MKALRQKAHELTIKNTIKPEDQSEWEALKAERTQFQTKAKEIQMAQLKAYVAALEKGMSKQMAQLEAEKSVQTEKNTLKASRIKMTERAQAFFKKYPQLNMHARNNKMNKHHPKNHQNMPKHPHR